MSKHLILLVWALVIASFAEAFGYSLDRERGSVFGPQRVERTPLVSFVSAEKGTKIFAENETFALSEDSRSSSINPALRVVLGFLVPGLPQYLDGQWRSYGYFAVEGASIASLIVLNSQGNSRRERYLRLAWIVRSNYVYPGLRNNPEEITVPSLPGFNEYYEDLTKWPSSGDFDDDPSLEGVQPESDPRTFNGHKWEIAKINNYSGTNGGLAVPENPQEEINALEAYKQTIYPSEYSWDWTGLEREKQRYHELFDKSEDALRRRSTFVTILLANHLVSGLDVLIQNRINRSRYLRSARLSLHLKMDPVQGPTDREFQPRVSVSHRF
jgi:hypothetical protein